MGKRLFCLRKFSRKFTPAARFRLWDQDVAQEGVPFPPEKFES
jgi:hypothetical protein